MAREDEFLKHLTKSLIDDGKLIEAGWQALRQMAVAPDAPDIQLEEMRNAFFAGAQHLFGSVMGAMDPDSEPTADDMRRMDLIHRELNDFIKEYTLKHAKPEGRS